MIGVVRSEPLFGWRRRNGLSAAWCCILLFLAFPLGPAAQTSISLEQWREEAQRVRKLGENDAPRAYAEAQRLQERLPADAPASDRVWILNILARIEAYLALTEQAQAHAQQALDLAKEHGDREGRVEANLTIALNSVNQGRIDELIEVTTDNISMLESIDRADLFVEALLRTSLTYRRIGQIEDSVALAVQAMEVARGTDDPRAIAQAHQILGMSYDQSGRLQEALEHFRQMREQAREAGSRWMEADAVESLGVLTARTGSLPQGERLVREAMKIYREIGFPFSLATSLLRLSDILRRQARYSEITPLLDEALAIYDKYPNPIARWFALNARSENRQALGDLDAALSNARRGAELAERIGLPLYRGDSMRRLASVHAARGDHKLAYELAVGAAELSEDAQRQRASERVVDLVRRYESEARRREVEALKLNNERQAAQLERRELQQRWLWTVLGGSFILLAVTAFLFFHVRRSHQLLAATNAEIRSLNTGLERRVQERTAQLESAIRELEAFSYSVSHDLRAPLRAIDGFSRMLLEEHADRLDSQGVESLNSIRLAAHRMNQIIEDLLALSQASRAEMRYGTVDVTELARTISQELQRTEPQRNVQFVVEPGLQAKGDERLVRIVLENLLGNAWKFTSRKPAAVIEVGRAQTENGPAFYVRDNGAGFDATHSARMFGAFERLHSSREFPGSGIGLAIVQRIIDRHRGRIWAHGRLGEGATFYFTVAAPDELHA